MSNRTGPVRVAVTGGPGAGKTALLESLRRRGHAGVPEVAREIYRADSERDQSYEEGVRVYEWLRDWYVQCGYHLIDVPKGTVDERCEFVLANLPLRG